MGTCNRLLTRCQNIYSRTQVKLQPMDLVQAASDEGMDAGLLTRGPSMATSLEMKSLSPQNEAEPQPEPEPEGTHSWR